ncbi:MAG: hypothetical protein FWD53_06060 [Phycisphaerales bacterium]|nr:hypothetical protein [Phycisphaerales bacterium]
MLMMPPTKRAIFLSTIIALTAALWGCCATEPIKIPLTTTAIPGNTFYTPPSMFIDGKANDAWKIDLTAENPTKKLTLGGIEHALQAQAPAKPLEEGVGYLAKLIIKTSTQEYIVPSPSGFRKRPEPVELTLDSEGGGRKYLLVAQAYNSKNKELHYTIGRIMPAGIQSGKIGQTPIALFDSNFDGSYTAGEDGIVTDLSAVVAGPGGQKVYLVPPSSKYIGTSIGIFEIQNIAKDGSELTVLPYTGPTASIEVNAPPGYVGQIVLTSDAGLNITVSGKAGEVNTVIPGRYTVLAAALVVSKQQYPLMISGDGESGRMSPLKVKAGTKQILTLSGPKVLEFQPTLVDGKINIKTETLFVKGQAGETYKNILHYDYYDPENRPEVHLNVDGVSTPLGKMDFG